MPRNTALGKASCGISRSFIVSEIIHSLSALTFNYLTVEKILVHKPSMQPLNPPYTADVVEFFLAPIKNSLTLPRSFPLDEATPIV